MFFFFFCCDSRLFQFSDSQGLRFEPDEQKYHAGISSANNEDYEHTVIFNRLLKIDDIVKGNVSG